MLLSEYQDLFFHSIFKNEQSTQKYFLEYGATFSERLKIYQNNTIGILKQMLLEKFLCLNVFLGQDFLLQCLHQFILQNPPKNTDLNSYGQGFHLFLSKLPELDQFPWLPHIGKLEETLFLCENAPDDTAITPDEFHHFSTSLHDNIPIISLRSSAFLLNTPFSPETIIHLCETDSPDETQITTALENKEHYTLIFRPFLKTLLTPLDYSEFIFLNLINNKNSLALATEEAFSSSSYFDLQKTLEKHLLLGTFCLLQTKNEHLGG